MSMVHGPATCWHRLSYVHGYQLIMPGANRLTGIPGSFSFLFWYVSRSDCSECGYRWVCSTSAGYCHCYPHGHTSLGVIELTITIDWSMRLLTREIFFYINRLLSNYEYLIIFLLLSLYRISPILIIPDCSCLRDSSDFNRTFVILLS